MMIALHIDEIRSFTFKLFVGTMFDSFLVREATIVTFNSFTIDGHIRSGYYSDEELEENRVEEMSSWQVLKPVCFSLIKGKKLPGSFQIILQSSPGLVEQFLERQNIGLNAEDVQGLCLNIRYEEGSLYCVTATSLNLFTIDKTLEREWDEEIRLFFKNHEIEVSEL